MGGLEMKAEGPVGVSEGQGEDGGRHCSQSPEQTIQEISTSSLNLKMKVLLDKEKVKFKTNCLGYFRDK